MDITLRQAWDQFKLALQIHNISLDNLRKMPEFEMVEEKVNLISSWANPGAVSSVLGYKEASDDLSLKDKIYHEIAGNLKNLQEKINLVPMDCNGVEKLKLYDIITKIWINLVRLSVVEND